MTKIFLTKQMWLDVSIMENTCEKKSCLLKIKVHSNKNRSDYIIIIKLKGGGESQGGE